jgi:peptidoglycan/LPS O-acetylase OafA/YrhL
MFWSIAVEMQFYLLFPLIWKYIKEWKGALSLIAFLILVRVIAYLASGAGYDFVYFTIFGSLDLFLIGCLAQNIYSKNLSVNSPIAPIFFGVIAFGITSLEASTPKNSPLWIFCNTFLATAYAGMLVTYLNSSRQIIFSSFFSLIGRVSYSIYVWQFFIYHAALNFIPKEMMGGYQWGGVVFFLGVVPFSILSYHVIEKPFLNLRKDYIN